MRDEIDTTAEDLVSLIASVKRLTDYGIEIKADTTAIRNLVAKFDMELLQLDVVTKDPNHDENEHYRQPDEPCEPAMPLGMPGLHTDHEVKPDPSCSDYYFKIGELLDNDIDEGHNGVLLTIKAKSIGLNPFNYASWKALGADIDNKAAGWERQ